MRYKLLTYLVDSIRVIIPIVSIVDDAPGVSNRVNSCIFTRVSVKLIEKVLRPESTLSSSLEYVSGFFDMDRYIRDAVGIRTVLVPAWTSREDAHGST